MRPGHIQTTLRMGPCPKDNRESKVENLFRKKEAESFIEQYPNYPASLTLRAYTSRLLGSRSDLVLHGGGNTSVKLTAPNIVGEAEELIYIKGSGRDLADIEPDGFTGLRLSPLRKLLRLESISDRDMDNQLRIHRIDAEAPYPSVETLLHAYLPCKYVDHTHSDALLVLTNQKDGADLVPQSPLPEKSLSTSFSPFTVALIVFANSPESFFTLSAVSGKYF